MCPFEGVDTGNANAEVYRDVEYALEKGFTVALATRAYHGGVFPVCFIATRVEARQGVILGGDLTVPNARILPMMALPHVKGKHCRLRMIHSISFPTSRTQPFRCSIEISSSSL